MAPQTTNNETDNHSIFDHFGITEEMSESEQRKQVLKQVGLSGFRPSEPVEEALALWEYERNSVSPAHLSGSEANERVRRSHCQELDLFAQQFFDLNPPDRKTKWSELCDACKDEPNLLRRLEHLSNGLKVLRPPQSVGSELVDRLYETILKAFVAEPWRAARLRREFSQVALQDRRVYAQAVRSVQYTDIARLESPWIRYLATLDDNTPRRSAQRMVDVTPQPDRSGNKWPLRNFWIALIVCKIVAGLIHVGLKDTKRPHFDRPSNTLPSYEAYQRPWPDPIEQEMVAHTLGAASMDEYFDKRLEGLQLLVRSHPQESRFKWALLKEYDRLSTSTFGSVTSKERMFLVFGEGRQSRS